MSLADVYGGEVGELDADELLAFTDDAEADRRRAEARQAWAMAEIERRELFRSDGHADVRAFFRARYRWSASQANAMRRLSRLGVAAPVVLDELADGRLGRCQAGVLAKAYANPRVSSELLDVLDELLDHAAHMQAWEFEELVERWTKLVDHDGSFDARQRAHDERSARLGESDHAFVLRLFGPAVDGEHLRARLQRYIDAEWQLDWARCVAEHGDDACPAKMARTGEQRRYDAFLRMIFDPDPPPAAPPAAPATDSTTEPTTEATVDASAAADAHAPASATCSCGGTKRRGWPESVTNLMIDIATFEQTLDRNVAAVRCAAGRAPHG